MRADQVIGRTVAGLGPRVAFGVAGSGNLRLVNAMRAGGVTYHAACHEAGAVAMADGYARVTGHVGLATVHQGPGFTNALTALTEAERSSSPMVVLAAEHRGRGNQRLDVVETAAVSGAESVRVEAPDTAATTVAGALGRAMARRGPVVVAVPTDIQAGETETDPGVDHAPPCGDRRVPTAADLAPVVVAIDRSRQPMVLAGRGAAEAGPALRCLADRIGAVLTTTIVAKGLFAGAPFAAGFLGGLGSALTLELADEADLLLVFGSSLDPWTTVGGRTLGPATTVVVFDDDPTALARHPRGTLLVQGDAAASAQALGDAVRPGLRWATPELAARIANYRRANEIPPAGSQLLDPRRLTVELDRLLPPDRVVALDSGHFLAFPAMYMGSPDGRSFLFGQGFQSVGLGVGIGIGAAAGSGRVVATMLGDGGARMSLLEVETAVRAALPLLVVVYDDGGYGAEVHDFEPLGVDVEVARLPSRDLAGVARALGAEAHTVRSLEDLSPLAEWLRGPSGPLVLDCKVDPQVDAVSVMTEAGAAEWSAPAA